MDMFDFLSSSDPPYCLSREQEFYAKSIWHAPQIPQVKCHQCVCPSVDRHVQHHLIVWIAELRPPEEVRFYRFGHRNHGVQEDFHLPLVKPRGQAMIGLTANCFIFEGQWHIQQHRSLMLMDGSKNGSRS